MTLDTILFSFEALNTTIANNQQLNEIVSKLNQFEKEFISKIGEDLKIEYFDLKQKYIFDKINRADFIKTLSFGIKVGMELKEELKNSQL